MWKIMTVGEKTIVIILVPVFIAAIVVHLMFPLAMFTSNLIMIVGGIIGLINGIRYLASQP
jgi:hypothetical protein